MSRGWQVRTRGQSVEAEEREYPNDVKPETFQQQRDQCDLKEECGNRLERRGQVNNVYATLGKM